MTQFAAIDSPATGAHWQGLMPKERLETVNAVLQGTPFQTRLSVKSALPSGFVYVELSSEVKASERGVMLRAVEKILKDQIDEGLTIWCEPVGDKSALRKLRGIEVKAV